METFQQVAAVCGVLALAVMAAYLSRGVRQGGFLAGIRSAGGGRMGLIQRLPLTAQHSLCIVKVDGREIVLGLYPGGLAVLDAKPAQQERDVK